MSELFTSLMEVQTLYGKNLNMVIKYETPHSCLQFKLSHLNQV